MSAVISTVMQNDGEHFSIYRENPALGTSCTKHRRPLAGVRADSVAATPAQRPGLLCSGGSPPLCVNECVGACNCGTEPQQTEGDGEVLYRHCDALGEWGAGGCSVGSIKGDATAQLAMSCILLALSLVLLSAEVAKQRRASGERSTGGAGDVELLLSHGSGSERADE